jgi:acetylserotonin N-methyltransferase
MELLTLDKLPAHVLEKLDLQSAHRASAVIIAAEKFGLFRKLSGKKLTSGEIGKRTGIHANYRDFFLGTLVGLGMLWKKDGRFSNTKLAEKYFVKIRSEEWTRCYSAEMIAELESFSCLMQVLESGKSSDQISATKSEDYVEAMKKDPKRARDFTYMLYYYHQPHAGRLADMVDLSRCKQLLDIGGGSGVMTIALAKKYRGFKATILDIEPVCRTARKIIRNNQLQDRIDTQTGDIFEDIPDGYDHILTSDIGTPLYELLDHIYPRLPSGGKLIMADIFFSDDLTAPLERLFWKLISTDRRVYPIGKFITKLRKLGFKSIKKRKVYEDMWLLSAVKK